MELEDARHLRARTGFGATMASINRLKRQGWERAVKGLVNGVLSRAQRDQPQAWTAGISLKRRPKADALRRDLDAWSAWWLREMLTTPSPLTERLVLFWQGLFNASAATTPWMPLLVRHQHTLRANLLTDLRSMLMGVVADPAILLRFSPDITSRQGPGVAFARALIEEWTLGPSAATDEDLLQIAQAFTGWSVDKDTGSFHYHGAAHNDDEKTFMGRTGHFNGTDVVNILLDDPRTAERLTRRLWMTFIDDQPDEDTVTELAAAWRADGYRFGPWLEGLLLTRAFRDPQTRGRLIKSPVELVVGTARSFYLPQEPVEPLVMVCRALGQDLARPPEGGWSRGAAWLTSDTLALRQEWLRVTLLEYGETRPTAVSSDSAMAQWLGQPPNLTRSVASRMAAQVLLPGPPWSPVPKKSDARGVITHLVLDPSHQLT